MSKQLGKSKDQQDPPPFLQFFTPEFERLIPKLLERLHSLPAIISIRKKVSFCSFSFGLPGSLHFQTFVQMADTTETES